MNVLVAGGAVYIGSHVCVELIQAGHHVIVIDDFSNSKPEVLGYIKDITGQNVQFYAVFRLPDRSFLHPGGIQAEVQGRGELYPYSDRNRGEFGKDECDRSAFPGTLPHRFLENEDPGQCRTLRRIQAFHPAFRRQC